MMHQYLEPNQRCWVTDMLGNRLLQLSPF